MIGYGEAFIIVGAAAILIGPKELPRVSRLAGRATGRAVALLQEARAKLLTVANDAEVAKLHEEVQQGLFELRAIRNELRGGINIMNPGPVAQRALGLKPQAVGSPQGGVSHGGFTSSYSQQHVGGFAASQASAQSVEGSATQSVEGLGPSPSRHPAEEGFGGAARDGLAEGSAAPQLQRTAEGFGGALRDGSAEGSGTGASHSYSPGDQASGFGGHARTEMGFGAATPDGVGSRPMVGGPGIDTATGSQNMDVDYNRPLIGGGPRHGLSGVKTGVWEKTQRDQGHGSQAPMGGGSGELEVMPVSAVLAGLVPSREKTVPTGADIMLDALAEEDVAHKALRFLAQQPGLRKP